MEKVPDQDRHENQRPAAAKPLHHPAPDQHVPRVRERAHQAARHEHRRRRHDGRLPPANVRQLRPDRRAHCRREREARPDPGVLLARDVQALRDCRQRRADDGDVERGQEERQAEAEHDEAALPLAHCRGDEVGRLRALEGRACLGLGGGGLVGLLLGHGGGFVLVGLGHVGVE